MPITPGIGTIPSLMGLFHANKATSNAISGQTPAFDDDFSGSPVPKETMQSIADSVPAKAMSPEMQRALKYKRLNWKPDNTIDMSIWDQLNPRDIGGTPMAAQLSSGAAPTTPNTPGTTPPPSANVPSSSPSSGQASQQPSGGQQNESIWDKLSGKASDAFEGYKKWDKEWTKRAEDRGFLEKTPEAPETPWGVKSIEDEQWHNRKDAVLVDPRDPQKDQKMMDLARDENGNVDPEKFKLIQQYVSDEHHPAVQMGERQEREKLRQDYSSSPVAKAFGFVNPLGNQVMKWGIPHAQQWWRNITNTGGPITQEGTR